MQTEDRITGTLEQMPLSTLIETDARTLDHTSVDPVSGDPMVDVIDDGGTLTVVRGWQTIVDAKADGKASVPARITRVDRVPRPIPRMLALAAITPDSRLQPRVTMHEHVIAEYAERMREGAQFPPVDVVRDPDGLYWLAAGFHRYYARERAGFDEIAAIIHDGTLEDAILIAAPSNGSHGKPMSNADKERSVRMVLEHPRAIREAWSDQKIADAAGVARSTVSNYRHKMEATGRRPVQAVRSGADGKLYPIKAGPQNPTDEAAEPAANGHRSDDSGGMYGTSPLSSAPVDLVIQSVAPGVPLPTDDAAPVDLYDCSEPGCGLAFAVPSWHCRHCNKHWPVSEHTVCPECEVDPPVAASPSEPIVSVVDVPMPRPERPSAEPQAAYDPGNFKPEPAVGAFGMITTALDIIMQYSQHPAESVAAVPTPDVKRDKLNTLSASITYLLLIEQQWKTDLGMIDEPADETEPAEAVAETVDETEDAPTETMLVGRGKSHSMVHLIAGAAPTDREAASFCGEPVKNLGRAPTETDKICSKCRLGSGQP